MKTQKKKILWLDYESKLGERVCWKTIRGDYFEGIVVKMDENFLATIKLDDGKEVTYQC